MARKYFVVESKEGKKMEVTDNVRVAEEKARIVDGPYQTVNEREARRIAEITQWGFLPEDVHNFFS